MLKNDSFLDNIKELVDGGWIMLFIFGGTICFLASASLIALCFLHESDTVRLSLFKEILIGALGYLTGIFTTMWNNKHFKSGNPTNGDGRKTESNPPVA